MQRLKAYLQQPEASQLLAIRLVSIPPQKPLLAYQNQGGLLAGSSAFGGWGYKWSRSRTRTELN